MEIGDSVAVFLEILYKGNLAMTVMLIESCLYIWIYQEWVWLVDRINFKINNDQHGTGAYLSCNLTARFLKRVSKFEKGGGSISMPFPLEVSHA